MFCNSHVFVNVSPARTWALSGIVTSRKRIAASIQFAEVALVTAELGVPVSDGAVEVKAVRLVAVGAKVAVIKFCCGVEMSGYLVMEIQELRRNEIRVAARNFFSTIFTRRFYEKGSGKALFCLTLSCFTYLKVSKSTSMDLEGGPIHTSSTLL